MNVIPPYIAARDYDYTTGNGNFMEMPSTNESNTSFQYGSNIGQICEYAAKRLAYVDLQLNPLTGEIILRENFSPAGQSWVDTVSMMASIFSVALG